MRVRDLLTAAVAGALIGYLGAVLFYRWFPPVVIWIGSSLALIALAEAGWAFYVRRKIARAEIGVGGGRLDPLAVARSVALAQASAVGGALLFGGWAGIAVFLLDRASQLAVAASDAPGAVVAAVCALALSVAGMWLQHCCKAPDDPLDDPFEDSEPAEG
ncbi:DUF3180 domain-containing protein [Mycolicibacterium brumae]|uniref:DUF3180 domain-containing protein n=1 Tax=Mycolicibacterium brumae TaxID=85968 RepID=A0A2G5P6W8_9MYCO|nr:DUF3180 domain-containing protein [Mycolicibacterium brumae]MCV7193785.1 DUF3180 domain-containing protein [Mycolicibacterium brumae]PIB74007.1 DUF3180 domain-containing protein [Mycolicibacterium brumae]UWW07336.1 DUF3180 domain-containing protein [Mycolicibacterium brumae]